MANILKIKNEQGEWISVPAIKGDAGPQGQAGPQGPKGDPGEVTTQQMTDYVAQELASKQDKLDSYSDSASVANDKLTINYKVKQEDGTYSDVPVEFSGGSKYTFTDGLTETNGTVSLGGKLSTDNGAILKPNSSYGNFITFDNNQSGSSHHYISVNNQSTLGFSLSIDGYSKGIKILTSKDSKIYSTLPIIPSGFNEQDINIDLGNNAHKWRTLYCANLSDGTTTKTMTELLAGGGESTTYMHVLKLISNDSVDMEAWATIYTKSETPLDIDTLAAWFTAKGLTDIPASGSGSFNSLRKLNVTNIYFGSDGSSTRKIYFKYADIASETLYTQLVSSVEDTVVAVD